jgi:uncharacterized membrane protein
MSITDVVLAAATTTVGLTAGVMFCYQIAVMPGLHELSDPEFISAFQQIDRKIVRPPFLLTFFGGGVLLVAGTALEGSASGRFEVLVIASALYLIGVLVITMTGHVPRNAALARVPARATAEEAARARTTFEGSWNRLHVVRTLAAVASLVLVATAVVGWD